MAKKDVKADEKDKKLKKTDLRDPKVFHKMLQPGLRKSNGLSVGLNKGHIVKKREARHIKGNYKKHLKMKAKHLAKGPENRRVTRAKMIREIVREVAGLAPYEKKMIDVFKVLGSGADKKVYKIAKKRLGTHKRAIQKRDELKNIYALQRARG